MGSISRVSSIVDSRLLIIIIVSGFWVLVLIVCEVVIGSRLNIVSSVVISIVCRCCSEFCIMDCSRFMFCLCSWVKWLSIIMLFSIVCLNNVIKLIVVDIDSGMLVSYRVRMLLIIVSGMLVRISVVLLMFLKVLNSSMKMINIDSGII